ncbi:MAG: dTDP-4-dehydrorhamnose 3,5-epimerase [Pseudomonadota bacterium]
MKITATPLADLLLIEPTVFSDERGCFFESFNQQKFNAATGLDLCFVQDNQTSSQHNVLRGLHYQLAPQAQGKLVRVLAGEIFDVAVDLRPDSNSLGQSFTLRLSAENRRQLWIPEGFAHGFLVLSATAEVLYKATAYYAPSLERSIAWNDPDLAIAWPDQGKAPILSAKDAAAPHYKA